MKTIFHPKLILHLVILLVITFGTAHAQVIPLPNECKFQLGDNMDWANPLLNDAEWGNKLLGTSWSATGMKENVYSWYRIKIVIPSSMKSLAEHGKGLKLNLGKIDDVDQTFFNGKLIGQTGSLPPQYETKWDAVRVYRVSEKDVQWDKENVIAVRVFSPDVGGIGMYEGPYSCAPIQWSDSISLQQSISETENIGFTTRLTFTNQGNSAFDGTVRYWIADKSNKELFTEIKPVRVQPVPGFVKVVTFSNYQPANGNIFRVGYQVAENTSSATVRAEQIYLADRQIEIPVEGEPKAIVENKVQDAFTSVPFQNQKLQGYLGTRFSRNLEERLLKVDENEIINGYLQRPGNHPWVGEHVGKYLEAACNVWKQTHDVRVKKQMDRIMFELMNSQLEDGYLGTYVPHNYWTSWDVWSHKYNLYGLLAYYTTTGYKPALESCKKIGDLLCATFGNKTGQRDIILAGTHIGMAATSILDPMVELYKYTGETKYLDFCYYILEAWEQDNGPKIISTLLSTGKVHKVADGKAYEMISNFVGLINLYRVTGDTKFLTPVLIAWQDIVEKRLYVTGTASSWEHFQDDEVLPAGEENHMGEGCVTTTWIQLNHQLLAATGELKYLEQIEKTVYNHLVGAENPETGCVSYYTPLMGPKPFVCTVSCCVSSVPRGIAMTPYFTFGNVKNVPTILIYEPATYTETIATSDGKNRDVSIRIESSFPEKGDVIVTVNTSDTASFPIALRVPSWCSSFVAKVGDKKYKGTANESVVVNRVWKSGETVRVSFEMPIRVLTGGKSYPDQIAFQRGPQVLAFDNSLNTELSKESQLEPDRKVRVEKPNGKSNSDYLPKQWFGNQAYTVKMVDGKKTNASTQLILVPYADAGQTGGVMKVWLPLSIGDK